MRETLHEGWGRVQSILYIAIRRRGEWVEYTGERLSPVHCHQKMGGRGCEHTRSVTAVDVVLVAILVRISAAVVHDIHRVSAYAVDPALADVFAVVGVLQLACVPDVASVFVVTFVPDVAHVSIVACFHTASSDSAVHGILLLLRP